MCGRYGLTIDQETVAATYEVERLLFNHEPRYNIAPSQDVPVLLDDERGRRVEGFRWGLVPFWADDPKIGYRTINARAETVAGKPAFRNAWKRRRRCLVLATGFYEWQKPASGKGPKRPHWIRLADARPFGFAGLWERWDGGGEPLYTCTILTTDANELVGPIHPRMPVILGERWSWNAWVDPEVAPAEAEASLAPYPAEEMHAQPVSTYVNSPRNEGPQCIELDEG